MCKYGNTLTAVRENVTSIVLASVLFKIRVRRQQADVDLI